MRLQTIACESEYMASLSPGVAPVASRNWYAVFTIPQHEKSVLKHLDMRAIESFLPTYQTVRIWKNRQRMRLILPLFPTYLFVHIDSSERTKVLQSPGVLQIVGNGRIGIPLQDSEIEFLRAGCRRKQIEPYCDFVIGKKVRIKSGVMQGLQGTLVRKNSSMKFVLTLELINQNAAIEIDADCLEAVVS
jgi:transcription antitermination factor NusG